ASTLPDAPGDRSGPPASTLPDAPGDRSGPPASTLPDAPRDACVVSFARRPFPRNCEKNASRPLTSVENRVN
ncbi:MAG: hypothetical protein IJO46_05720, partial [Thermoguttaceae bacterium]|nr:hypothetical protein [Thermoguttaceae bacterium]